MKQRDISLTIALCASFAAHAFLLRGLADRYVKSIGHIFLAAAALPHADENQTSSLMMPLPLKRRSMLGDDDPTKAHGEATDAESGERALESTKVAPTPQPILSRDAPGNGGSPKASAGASAPPPDPEQPKPEPAQAAVSPRVAPAKMPDDSPPVKPAPVLADGSVAPKQPTSTTSPSDAIEKVHAAPVQVAIAPTEKPSEKSQTTAAAPATPSAQSGSPGKPIPQAETESDPFTSIGSAEIHAGSIDAQIGRPHRLTRPHIDLAALVDASTLDRIRVILQLTIDRTGNVVNAVILEPSGSFNIDQATRLAAYEWWFKPKGLASETFTFSVGFR